MVRKREPRTIDTSNLLSSHPLQTSNYPLYETGTVSHGNVCNRNIATPALGKLNVIQLSKAS